MPCTHTYKILVGQVDGLMDLCKEKFMAMMDNEYES